MTTSSFQQKLKEATNNSHTKAEQHPLMQSFIRGSYKKENLLQFLVNLYPIYSVVEQRLLSNTIKQVPCLKRTEYIENDVNNLITNIVNVKNLHLLTPLPCTCAWVSNCWKKPVDLLKAEFYSRWLADLYGGKMLMKVITPNEMYKCEDYNMAIQAVRSRLDEPNIEITENDLIQETLSFFDFHLELFNEILSQN